MMLTEIDFNCHIFAFLFFDISAVSVSRHRSFIVFQVPSAGHGPAASVAEEHWTGELDSLSTPVHLPRTFFTFVLQGAMGYPLPGE